MKSIGIVGYGYVGKAFARMFDDQVGRYNQVEIFDPFIKDPQDAINQSLPANQCLYTKEEVGKEMINNCDVGVICVPTPSTDDGGCDTSIVEEVVGWLETPVILIKSTVKPGTVDRLTKLYPNKKIVFSPEYVGEGRYFVTQRMDFQTDMKKCPFLICGGKPDACAMVFDALVPLLGPEKTYYECPALEAELIKYMENTYFAAKITFAQEMYEIVKAHGADWYKVWQGWALDPRVDIMHTAVFPDARGFSGKCLPKDTNALVLSSMDHGYTPSYLIEMLNSNHRFRPDEPIRVKVNA